LTRKKEKAFFGGSQKKPGKRGAYEKRLVRDFQNRGGKKINGQKGEGGETKKTRTYKNDNTGRHHRIMVTKHE